METYKDFENFKYFGVYVDCYFDNKENDYKKRALMPKSYKLDMDNENNEWKNNLNNVWDKNRQMKVKPNGIAIMTKRSNLTVIDIDKPEKVKILDKLINDCKFIVKTRKGFHLYFNRCNDIPNQTLLKILDVNTNLIYYIPKYNEYNVNNIKNGEYINKDGKKCYFDKYEDYKLNKNVEFNYELIKNEGLCDLPEYAINYIDLLISLKDEEEPPKNKIRKTKPEIILKPDYEIEKFNINIMDNIMKILYDNNYFNDLKKWLKVAYMCRNVNNTDECFNLFHKYSTMVEKYKNNTPAHNSQYFNGNNKYDLNFDENALLLLVKRENGKIFKEKLEHLFIENKYDDEIVKFNRKYLIANESDEDYETHNEKFKDFINIDEFKFLLIKSPYGTGKTRFMISLLNETLDENNKNFDVNYLNPITMIQDLTQPKFKKVVFITYRQSLAHTLYNELSEQYNFKHYQDIEGDININRVIIQLDSILRLNSDYYDLIVLDELEGLLFHFNSPLIKNQYTIYKKLESLILKSKKILCMDGDLYNRAYDFIYAMNFKQNWNNYKICNGKTEKKNNQIKDTYYKIYQNTIQPNKKHFIFYNGDSIFYKNISDDLENGLKIVIVSMSANACNSIKEMFKNYNICIHTGIEKNIKILRNYMEEWSKCDLLIYSPTIEAGVDFNMEYFDKCYGLVCKNSTKARPYLQMLSRVRNFKENTIKILMLGIPNFIENALIYRKEEIESIKYSEYNEEDETFINIMLENETEEINSNVFLITELTRLLKLKGHTYEYIPDTPNRKKEANERPKYIKIMKILNSQSISEDEFLELEAMKKQNLELTPDNYYSIQKYLYTKYFNVNYRELTYEFIEDRLDKFNIVGNVRRLLSYCNKNNQIENFYNKCLIYETPDELINDNEKYINIINPNMTKTNINVEIESKKKQKIILNIIKNFGYNIDNNKLIKINDEYDIKKIEQIYNSREFKILFQQSRQLKELNTFKCLNEILEKYGLEFKNKRIHSHYEEKEGETIRIYKYTIVGKFINIIEDLINPKEKPKENTKEKPKEKPKEKEEYKYTDEEIKQIEKNVKEHIEKQEKEMKQERLLQKFKLNKKIENAKKKGKTELKLTKLERELLQEMKEEFKN